MSNVSCLLHDAIKALKPQFDAPDLDAEWILLHVLGMDDVSWIYAHGEYVLTEEQTIVYKHLVSRRVAGEPLAYILGTWEFYGREFMVTRDVLIPRPSTENLVEIALDYISTSLLRNIEVLQTPFVIADIGTGCGCIIISLVRELERNNELGIRNYAFIATDVSARALNVAKRNADKHGVSDAIEFIQGDMLEPLVGRHVDLIVSNPPYVPTGELVPLPLIRGSWRGFGKKALMFEPRIALDGGFDGTTYVTQILTSGIPAIVETQGGNITSNIKSLQRSSLKAMRFPTT